MGLIKVTSTISQHLASVLWAPTASFPFQNSYVGMDIVQNNTLQSTLRKGEAVITSTTLLIGGWVPEVSVTCFHCIAFDLIEFIQANDTVIVQVTATQGVGFHLWSQFEMLYKS